MTPNRLTPEAFRDAPKTPVRVVLENIRSGLNVSVCGGIVLWDAAQKIGLPG